MSRIVRTYKPVYPARVLHNNITHWGVIETVPGQLGVLSRKTLCGATAARYTEATDTPVRCANCNRIKARLESDES